MALTVVPLIFNMLSAPAHGINVSVPAQEIRFHDAPDRHAVYRKSDSDAVIVGDFKSSASGKFLMIAQGPEFTSVNYARGASFSGEIPDDHCRIADGPQGFDQPFEDRLNRYAKQTLIFNHCTFIKVTDSGAVLMCCTTLNQTRSSG